MDFKELKESAAKIVMPEEMKERIIRNCRKRACADHEVIMKKKHNSFIKKPAAIAACILSLLFTASIAAGQFGFFKDIFSSSGAVIGTEYKNAENEIRIANVACENGLSVKISFARPSALPFMSLTSIRIHEFEIKDASGNAVMKGCTDFFGISNEGAEIRIPFENMPEGEYILTINAFEGRKKADQPLVISGNWAYEFSNEKEKDMM